MAEPIKIWRSAYSHFGRLLKIPDEFLDETITASSVYTETQLSEIAESGFNAIWIYGRLSNIADSGVFQAFGTNASIHQKSIQKLINRAAKHNLKVYILMQPPRAIDVEDSFWNLHPEVGGEETDFQTDDGYDVRMRSLCTSTQPVKDFLYRASAELAAALPHLGGIILITASEFPSHCYGRLGTLPDSSGNRQTEVIHCPRCSKHTPAEIIGEIIQLVHDGIRSVNKNLNVIAWNWAWDAHYPSPCDEITSLLPNDVIVMAGFEQGGKKMILGKERIIDEYSLSYSGPSRQFIETLNSLRRRKLRMMVKLQIGTTHELATVPNLPLIGNLYNKAKTLRLNGITDFLACWNFGNMISINTSAFTFFMGKDPLPKKQNALALFAQEYFPGCRTESILQAWEYFEAAMDYYPFAASFLYSGPLNYALAYPLNHKKISNKKTGRSWVMDDRGDNLEDSLTEFNLKEVISGLDTLSRRWNKGLRFYEEGLETSNCPEAARELNTARVCFHIFRSGRNIYQVYELNRNFQESQLNKYLEIIRDEFENLKEVLPLISKDKRIGFHSEAQDYMFTPVLVREKIAALESKLTGRNITHPTYTN